MIIILFRGRETIAPAGSGRRDSFRGIRNLPSAAHPAWMNCTGVALPVQGGLCNQVATRIEYLCHL